MINVIKAVNKHIDNQIKTPIRVQCKQFKVEDVFQQYKGSKAQYTENTIEEPQLTDTFSKFLADNDHYEFIVTIEYRQGKVTERHLKAIIIDYIDIQIIDDNSSEYQKVLHNLYKLKTKNISIVNKHPELTENIYNIIKQDITKKMTMKYEQEIKELKEKMTKILE